MTNSYQDYIWKNGKPYGINKIAETGANISYRVIADPYYKRISLEKYVNDRFNCIIYDSAIFDFRHLKPAEQNAWQKITISEAADKTTCHIRNQDDRLVLIEDYTFENNLCRGCNSFSSHGIQVSSQKIFYKFLGDTFDGTILYDQNNHPVVYKIYKVDPETQEFSDLIEEQWDMSVSMRIRV